MSSTKYVMMVVFDPSLQFVVGITKKKGPAFLLNKVTFPGGRVEDGESSLAAAAREMLEETGLNVPLIDWVKVDHFKASDREMTTYAAVSDKFFCARTCELEPVWQLNVARHQQYAAAQPAQYAPDFLTSLARALSAVSPSQQAAA